ncbi:MAG: phytoene desaturase family protein [Mycobacteriales bacterium]
MQRYDAIVVGGGHNGLTAAAYLASASRSVLVLEAADHTGGAAVSAPVFTGVDARLSRYAYLVSLLPQRIVSDLGLRISLRRRRFSSYTPVPGSATGLLIDNADPAATGRSFAAVTGSDADFAAWQRFSAMTGRLAARMFPTMLDPLKSRDEMRTIVDDPIAWNGLLEEPIGSSIRTTFADDTVRGVVATDALIGTFTSVDNPSLLANRCFLYHVIGGGTGAWDVPVGGMGAVTDALAAAAREAGARIETGADVVSIDPDGEVRWIAGESEQRAAFGHLLGAIAPQILDRLLGDAPAGPRPEGAQLKVNMLLSHLPRLADPSVDPAAAFGGTFHVNEGLSALEASYAGAARGEPPAVPPCESYGHSLTDPSILGPELARSGAHTLTLFGLHQPARLFAKDNPAARAAALAATLDSLDAVLGEPIRDCLLTDADGRPCLEARTPLDLEREIGLPGGHIFHRDLSWPFAEADADIGRWGVETAYPNVLLAGAGARRGGGVSGIPGHNAAMAVLRT